MATAKGSKIGFWTMVRDVLVASLNKGQFPVALLGIFLIVAIVRMPRADVSRLVFEVKSSMLSNPGVGFLIAVLAIGGWAVHARHQRKRIQGEMDRVANERDQLQAKLGATPRSSRRH